MRVTIGSKTDIGSPLTTTHHHEVVTHKSNLSNVSAHRTPSHHLNGQSIYPKHYYNFLKQWKQVYVPRAKSSAAWGVVAGFWAWYFFLPHSNMLLRRVFLGEVSED
ncbi:hypothetical protein ABK040_007505 [Willaertia magna]